MGVRRFHPSPAAALALALGVLAGIDAARWIEESARAPPGDPRPAALVPDINRAPARHLLLLPGIGPVRAGVIVEERIRAGPFVDVDDLVRVHGIGPRTVAGLRAGARASDP